MDDVIILIKDCYTVDAMGQRVASTQAREVFCTVSSVTGTEWASGSQNGIRPEYRVVMFRFDYHDEKTVNMGGELTGWGVVGGTDYTVYRTYRRDTDQIELYLEKRAGS